MGFLAESEINSATGHRYSSIAYFSGRVRPFGEGLDRFFVWFLPSCVTSVGCRRHKDVASPKSKAPFDDAP
jgi:hypothetical protein